MGTLNEESESSIFPRTKWTALNKAAEADTDELDRLIRLYWAPLKIFLIATFPSLKNEADVLLQEFAEDKILKTDWLRRADPNRGRFRDFLKTSLRHFVVERFRHYEAKHPPVPFDESEHRPSGGQNPAEAFDLLWVRTLLAQTLLRMETDCKNPQEPQPRRSHIWEMFQIRVLAPIFEDAVPIPYDQLILRFELKSPSAASNLLLSAKRIFRMHLNRVIEEYGERDAATAMEVNALVEFVQRMAKEE